MRVFRPICCGFGFVAYMALRSQILLTSLAKPVGLYRSATPASQAEESTVALTVTLCLITAEGIRKR